MKALQTAALVCSLLCVAIQPADAGAWAQPRGHAYAKVSGIFYHAEDVYNDMGRRQEMGINDDEFTGRQMFIYLEYGLRDRLTLVTQARAGALTDEDAFVRMQTTGIGDLEAGLKYQLVDQPAVVALMVSLKIPTGYDAGYDPALGTGKVDAETRLLVSRSFYPLPVYAGLDVGYRLRGGAFSNQWSWSAEVGVTPHARIFGKIFVSGTNTLVSSSTANLGVVGVSAQVSEGDSRNISTDIAIELVSGVWLDVLLEQTIDGENIGAGMSWGIGLSVSR